MRTKLILSVLALFSFSLFGISQKQSAYYDAKFIYDSCFDKNDEVFDNKASLYDVLTKKYYPDGTSLSEALLKENPFFKEFVPAAMAQSGGRSNFIDKGLSSLGGLDVTKFANAIADIMIERAKQELTVAFFERFKKFSKNNPEFEILFPKTTTNLANLLTYTYPQMLPALRKGFFDDLGNITYRLDDVLELPKYRHLLKNFPEVTVAIRSLRLIHDLQTGSSNIAGVIKDFAGFPEWNRSSGTTFKNMGSTIKFASIFSESLRNEDTTKIWVESKEIKKLVSDEVFVKIFMGLIYQQIKNENKGVGIKFYFTPDDTTKTTDLADSILAKQKDNIILFQNKISEFINLADKVQDTYDGIKGKKEKKEKVSNEEIFDYINVSIDIADYTFSIVKIFDENLVADNYLTIVRKSNSLYKDIYSSQYTQAVNDAVDILTEVHNLTTKNTSSVSIARTGAELDKKPALDTLLNFVEKVKPYALFMANMVEAKDEAAVKAALENVILPVGSSSIKKNTLCNISLQTYLGAYWTPSAQSSSLGTWSDKFGVAAPIGISWTPGFLSWQKAGSLSLFTSLFDLGAIVDYKLKKEPNASSSDPNATVVTKDYSIKFGQIFSPGVYAVYGFPVNLPLSLGFGFQYGPGLSKINVDNTTVITNPYVRWNFFLAVDMPFFTLKHTNKAK